MHPTRPSPDSRRIRSRLVRGGLFGPGAGRVNIFDIITPPHHDVIGGMTGGVAVIDALVRVKKGKRGGKLTLLIGAGNTNLSEAKVSVIEVGVPHLF